MSETTLDPATIDPAAPGALEQVTAAVVAQINKGSLTFEGLLKALSPKQESAPAPVVVPTPKAITEAQREAVASLDRVYGKVVPAERRALAPVEVEALVEEKQTLDTVKKMAEERLKDITVTAHNHLDVVLEESGKAEGVLLDGNGHYIAAGRAGAPGVDKEFSREVRNYAADLTLEGLEAAEAEGLIDHATFLAMTRQVRVVDEARVMEVLSKNPGAIRAIARATTPGKTGTAIALRKRK